MVLDRQIAFALGWLALAQLVVQPDRGPARRGGDRSCDARSPSAGLQLALVLAASMGGMVLPHAVSESELAKHARVACGPRARRDSRPGSLTLGPGRDSWMGCPLNDFWLLSVELQSPQHMLPHLWRMPQWLACFSYLARRLWQSGF